ncbi:hypothetical protein KAU30_02625 [Candidatus Bathyarchaeota archaeon]|nr:hypothetical protein [Candidatus Bathyarchaeota archaeon]
MTVKEKRLDFTTVREGWSEYKLTEDGSEIKIKVTITEIVDTGIKEGKVHKLRFGTQNLFFKELSSNDKGEPSETPDISKEDIIQDLEFEKVVEPINMYDVPEKLVLLVNSKLLKIEKTKKFSSAGNRIYRTDIACAVSAVPYPK